MGRKAKKDTSELLTELRILVNELDLAVYHILVRRAGFAVQYAKDRKRLDGTYETRVNRYYPTMREAVKGELKEMAKELSGSKA